MTSKNDDWYTWGSPIEMGIGLAGLGIFFYLGSLALYTLIHL
jgi:hypothetical protein